MDKAAFFTARRAALADQLRAQAAAHPDAYEAMRLMRAARSVEPRPTHGVVPALSWLAGKAVSGAGRGAAAAAEQVLKPAPGIGSAAAKAFKYVSESPTLAMPLTAAVLAAPYFMSKAKDEHEKRLEEYNKMIQQPGRISIASEVTLNSFFEKTAQRPPIVYINGSGGAPRFDRPHDKLLEGIGKAVGERVTDLGISAIGGAVSSIFSSFGRRKLLENLLETDTVLADAVRRNPAMRTTLVEAFGTMLRFAPSLTDDVNAVRSFLREVVLGGGHVNYAVIKHLVDTQKAMTGR